MESNKNQNQNVLIQSVLNYTPVVLAALLPVFFLPVTLEFFEFNKLMITVVATGLILLTWVAKMLYNKEVTMVKSTLDLPIVLLFVAVLLATIFSINKTASIFGSQGRWFPSLYSFIVLVGLYYGVASNIRDSRIAKTVLMAFVGGTTVSTIVALLGYYGVKLGTSLYLQVANFTLTGSVTTAAVIAAVATVVAAGLLTYESKAASKVFFLQAAILNLVGTLLLGSLASYAVLGAGTIALLVFTDRKQIMVNKSMLSVLMGAAVITILMLVTPATRSIVGNENYPKEISLSARESWVVTLSVLRDFPVLATGPSTFYLNYPRYKSLTQNNTDVWNVRFDKAYNEIFGLVAGLGVVGLLAASFLAWKVALVLLDKSNMSDKTGVTQLLVVASIALFTAFLFTHATVLTAAMSFLFLSLVVGLGQIHNGKHVQKVSFSLSSISESMSILGGSSFGGKKETLQYVIAAAMLTVTAYGGYYGYRTYLGEYYMRKSIIAAQQSNGGDTYTYQTRAIQANPQRGAYYNALARTNIALANAIASQENLSETDSQNVQQLIAQAIQMVRTSTEVISPLDVSGWETRALVYSALRGVAQDADVWAKGAYNTAIQLDPTNPSLRLALGGLHYTEEDYLTAANYFRQSVSLKTDYANARYNFASALVKLEAYEDAQRELEIVKRLVPESSPDAQKVAEELEALKNLPAVAGAKDQATKPTVEELQGVPANTQEVKQEPLASPEEVVGQQVIEPAQNLQLDQTLEQGNNSQVPATPNEGTQPQGN
ncbi:MAG: hypothetical protein R3B92_04735 [Patescibacteria group bacterium]